ncbi:MAG TPA: hypothetical protein RMG48_22265 [Myxococcales bacterium LLY-WYZ-16_1]|jgi:hypothetical protein|nr:hypothetical protein [Myxococcales bacterium LLY-WYZ-16_1]
MTLLATVANDPDHMPSLLFALDKELSITDARPGSAWGIGYHAEDRALTIHKPAELVARKGVYGVAPNIRSRILLACNQRPEPPLTALDRAPPHRFRRWLFACRGELRGLEGVRGRVREKLPDFLGLELGDGAVSELAFAIFLAELRRDGVLDDPLATVEGQRTACARAMDAISTLMADTGNGGGVPAAFALSNGRTLILSRGSAPLFYREQHGLDRPAEGPLDPARTDFNDLAQALKRFRAVILASGPSVGEGWSPIPEGATAAIDLQLQWSWPTA